MIATTRAAGRRLKLSHLLRINGQRGKAGAGCDAPGLWQEGKLDALERYCMRDVEALAELVLRDTVKVPGGTAREATVWHALSRRPAEGGSSSSDTPLSGTIIQLSESFFGALTTLTPDVDDSEDRWPSPGAREHP